MGAIDGSGEKPNTPSEKNILKRAWYFLVKNNVAEISVLCTIVVIILIVSIYSFPNEFQKLIELIFRK